MTVRTYVVREEANIEPTDGESPKESGKETVRGVNR